MRRHCKKMETHENKRNIKKELQILMMLLLIELLFFLYSVSVGKGIVYFQIAVVLIPTSLIACFGAYHIKGNQYLVIWTTLLLNFGFLVQALSMTEVETISMIKVTMKLLIVLGMAAMVGVFYRYCSHWLSVDYIILALFLFQLVLCMFLWFLGEMVGTADQQGALLNLRVGSILVQPLEIVKMIFIFIMAGLLCKDEMEEHKFFHIKREIAALIYMIVTALLFTCFIEFGTLAVLTITGACMFWIFGQNRTFVRSLFVIGGAFVGVFAVVCVLFHEYAAPLNKVFLRFKYLSNPEMDAYNSGFQGLQIKKALTIGGYFGPDTERYLFEIYGQENDMVFAKLIQTSGIFMGIFMIGAFVLILREGYKIAAHSKDIYYRGIAMGTTLLIAVQAVVHIGCNVTILPITGLPLPFVSEGFTCLSMSLCTVAILLIISTGTQERSAHDEEAVEKFVEQRYSRFMGRKWS